MREIRFRAWDKKQKQMLEPLSLFDIWSDGLHAETDAYWGTDESLYNDRIETLEFMQYTGLTDKNGKPIYEGDIVQHADAPELKATITYIDMGFTLTRIGKKAPIFIPKHKLEVVGNIHESPELLQ